MPEYIETNMEEALSITRIARLNVPYLRSKPSLTHPGIILVGLPSTAELPAMLLVVDEAENNRGASATNCMDALLVWAQENWPELGVKTDIVVLRDSMGKFNHIQTEWCEALGSGYQAPPLVTFKPVRWPGEEHCSLAAVMGMFGDRAKTALALAAERSRTDLRP
jgi:hypothetical protein